MFEEEQEMFMGKTTLCLAAVSAFVLSAFSFSYSARADETTESKVKIEDVTEQKATPPGGDIDQTITNNKMRAETGSKSRYSFSSQLYYNGSSIETPLAMSRPNIAGATGTTDTALLGGQLFGKYNINSADSLQLGVGVRWASPLQGSAILDSYRAQGGQKYDIDNPFLTYQHLYKWYGIQSALQVTPTYFTNSNLVHGYGYVAWFAVSQNNIYEIGKTGISLGFYMLAQTGFYNNNSAAAASNQATLVWNFDPFLEYQINNTFNLRTVSNLWNYEHTRDLANNVYTWDKVTQSVGVGISVSRDVFLYPNIQFLPDNIRSDLTNVAINTYVNL